MYAFRVQEWEGTCAPATQTPMDFPNYLRFIGSFTQSSGTLTSKLLPKERGPRGDRGGVSFPMRGHGAGASTGRTI